MIEFATSVRHLQADGFGGLLSVQHTEYNMVDAGNYPGGL
jgi:hypothetical protein